MVAHKVSSAGDKGLGSFNISPNILVFRCKGDILAILAQARDSVFLCRKVIIKGGSITTTAGTDSLHYSSITVDTKGSSEVGIESDSLSGGLHAHIVGQTRLGFKRNLGKVGVVSLGVPRVYARGGGPAKMAGVTPCGART